MEKSRIVILAVKPQNMDEVLTEISSAVKPDSLVTSIAAGVKLGKIRDALKGHPKVTRVMPNTPALIGMGTSGLFFSPEMNADERKRVLDIFRSVGIAEEIDKEELMDVVTGLSGSGPAYGFMIIEAMADGAVLGGLPRHLAKKFAAQTLVGAAMMVMLTGKHPADLKDMVTSPGGTTIAGLKALEEGGLRSSIIAAINAATKRSRELG